MTPFVAAVDWGTSSFRLWLLARDGSVLAESRSDDGMMSARETGFAAVLDRHLAEAGAPENLPVVVCGMAGAKQGWREAAYLDAPAALDDLAAAAISVEAGGRDVRILPGICQRDAEWPDVMRGEETQLLGAAAGGLSTGLVCMPGTHCKWVSLSGGTVARFATFMTGDIHAAIAGHSILKLALEGWPEARAEDPVFAEAVTFAAERPELAAARLFGIRAGPLLGLRDGGEGAARLSGTLIGMEIAGARGRFGAAGAVTLVASGRLGRLYDVALRAAGLGVQAVDADLAVRAGLLRAAQALWEEQS